MGKAARDRFLDRTGMLGMSYDRAVNPVHNTIIMNLSRLRENLSVLIDQPIWDHGVQATD
jgi:hypothetical protein